MKDQGDPDFSGPSAPIRPAFQWPFNLFIALVTLFAAYAIWRQPSPPMREGTVAVVCWAEGNNLSYAIRDRTVAADFRARGNGQAQPGVDMYGRLFPNFLELTIRDQPNLPNVLIIPWSQITRLEFGEGGITPQPSGLTGH